MFRFVSSNNLKTRVVSQVTSRTSPFPAHNTSLNFRFNHSTTESKNIDISHDQNSVKSQNPIIQKNYTEAFQNHNGQLFKKQIAAFDECLSHTNNIHPNMRHDNPVIPTFWTSVSRIMPLYRDLSDAKQIASQRVADLVYFLHTALRLNRRELVALGRKPDYDSKSFNRDMSMFISASLKEIANDIITLKVGVSSHGVMHLTTSMKELSLEEEAVTFWDEGRRMEELKKSFLDPRVLGGILPIAFELGKISYEDCLELYNNCLESNTFVHPNFETGMLKIALKADKVTTALEIFAKLSSTMARKDSGYLKECHLAFISSSSDIGVANTFFERALEGKMPYRLSLQVPTVKTYMKNVYRVTNNFSEVENVWVKTHKFYLSDNVNSRGILCSLNDQFINLFFQEYPTYSDESFAKLGDVLKSYNEIRSMDETFLNSIMTNCVVWNNTDVIEALNEAYSLYQIKKSPIANRIYLKAMGYIDVSNEKIYSKWIELLMEEDRLGCTFIANADWSALKDATLRSTQYSEQRTDFYYKVFKSFSPYCQHSLSIHQLKRKDAEIPGSFARYRDIRNLDSSDIIVPEFKSLTVNVFDAAEC